MRIISVLLLLLFNIPVFAYDNPDIDERKFLVPVSRHTADTRRLYSQEMPQYETVCVEEQCYYVVGETTAKKLLSDGVADEYEPVIYRYLLAEIPSDTNFPEQWALNNDKIGWLDGKDVMDAVPPLGRNGGPVAAFIDSGIVDVHRDINYKDNLNDNGYNILWDTGLGVPLRYPADGSDDREGHGTHVAGIVGAANDNNFGVAGAGYGKVHIFPANASVGGASLSNAKIIDAIGFIISQKQQGVPVVAVNMSYGSYEPSKAEYNAMERLKENGIIVVAAAGNENYDVSQTPMYPGSYDLENIITVAALDDNLKLAGYSNYGGAVTIAAPGNGILSTAIYFLGKGVDNATNPSGILYQSTHQSAHQAPTNMGGNWSRAGEKLIYAKGTGSDNFTVDNINLTSVSSRKKKSVSLNYDNNLVCESSGCSLNMYIRRNNSPVWRLEAFSDKQESNRFFFYEIPANTTTISVMVLVDGNLSASSPSPSVTINKLLIGAADYADSLTSMSGTSMSAPFVTGIIAAGAAVYPDAGPGRLMNMLYDSARKIPELDGKVQGGRQIDIAAFLIAVKSCKDAGGACAVTSDYPERTGGFNNSNYPETKPPKIIVPSSSSGRNYFGCAAGGNEGGFSGAAVLILLASAVWLVRRQFS
ncbi:MAG: S8 family serine peptidase [Deferribacteraceae bacterium]|jgi:subtilisin family serine protease|nr:S8 family serine peptidase [Deferribacteraceae bacterium]